MRWRIALLVIALLAVSAIPANTATTPATDPGYRLMASVNQAREARGLVPLRSDPRLWSLAAERAGRLATSGALSHAAPGPLDQELDARGVRWFGYGEVIGYASGSAGIAQRTILQLWLASPDHWPLLMSARYNYLGIGFAYRSDSGVTFVSVVLTESPDRTGARAAVTGALVSDNDIRWSWSGADVPLQTHTAGLRDFTLQLRQDRGAWATIATAVTATARLTVNRVRGHWYGLRVRARDRAGNIGPWSRERRVWLP
ncbi:MAG: CAP domain-containing protein [Chloroflexi bacterium]|nr:CAP domain-containing protein [Chloroflexota bacterium]